MLELEFKFKFKFTFKVRAQLAMQVVMKSSQTGQYSIHTKHRE